MSKATLLNYITVIIAILTLVMCVYSTVNNSNRIMCLLLLILTLVVRGISNKCNQYMKK